MEAGHIPFSLFLEVSGWCFAICRRAIGKRSRGFTDGTLNSGNAQQGEGRAIKR